MVLHSFYWRYPASSVKITGDFDNWTGSLDMLQTEEGHFVKVIDIEANTKVNFKYIVDGNWTVDHDSPKEGEGVHENNVLYSTTTASIESGTPSAEKAVSDFDSLPTVGGALAYASTSPIIPAKQAEEVPVMSTYDESGPSPSDPAVVRAAREQPEQSLKPTAEKQILSEELSPKVTDTAVAAPSAIEQTPQTAAPAASLTAPQDTIVQEEPKKSSALPISAAVLGSAGLAAAAGTAALANKSASKTENKGTLEQTAIKAATAAASNAYTASGLEGVTAAPKDITKGADVGFTSIGTAVNTATGVVGTSKLVQSVNEVKPTEDTQTAKLAQGAAENLLAEHKNGVKTERIDAHTVLAEVGLGGAAIGTAVVTDGTVKDSSSLPIPAAAAEHLKASSASAAPVTVAATAAAGTAATAATIALAAPLKKDDAKPIAVTSAAPAALAAEKPASTVVPAASETRLPVAATATSSQVATTAPVAAKEAVRPVTADTQGSKTDASYKTASSASPQTLASVPAQKTMPSSLRTEKPAETAADPKKKKGGLLRKMKSMFKNKD